MAKGKGLDVVEVSPNTEPPVCKILDHGKYLFEQKKQSQGAKKKQKTIQVKEIKFRPLIEIGDYEVKVNKIRDFIDQGNKVKNTGHLINPSITFFQKFLQMLEFYNCKE